MPRAECGPRKQHVLMGILSQMRIAIQMVLVAVELVVVKIVLITMLEGNMR